MLTTMPHRVSALLAEPIQEMIRELSGDFRWNDGQTAEMWRAVAPLSMWEDESAFYVDMDVPGIALNDLDVTVDQGKLLIRGSRTMSRHSAECQYNERFAGQFERTVALNEWVDPQSIEATLENGILSLKLFKKPESRRQKVLIQVKSSQTEDAKRIDSQSSE